MMWRSGAGGPSTAGRLLPGGRSAAVLRAAGRSISSRSLAPLPSSSTRRPIFVLASSFSSPSPSSSPSSPSTRGGVASRRGYAVKSKNFERKEARFDFSEIKDRLWPHEAPRPLDYRNYVPPEEADEEDDWKPEEDYPEPSFSADLNEEQRFFPVITPHPVIPKIDPRTGAFLAIGRRKRAVARTALRPGDGKITINGRSFLDYFPCFFERGMVLAPFVAIERHNAFDVNVNVSGGGTKGQAEAIQLAIARALQSMNIAFRPALKKAGCLERDARIVESKKAGRVKARRRPQWSKR